jgi:hypothetical protein
MSKNSISVWNENQSNIQSMQEPQSEFPPSLSLFNVCGAAEAEREAATSTFSLAEAATEATASRCYIVTDGMLQVSLFVKQVLIFTSCISKREIYLKIGTFLRVLDMEI